MNSKGLTLIGMLLFPLSVSGCARQTTEGSMETLCLGLDPLVDSHVNALVSNGETLVFEAGEVLVTGDELVTVFDKACKGNN